MQQTIVNVRHPIRVHGQFIGFISTAVSTEAISQFLQGLDVKGWTPFILYDRDYVLATPYFDPSIMKLDRRNPLPRLNIGIDPILANIWAPERSTISTIDLGSHSEASEVKTPSGSTIFLWRELNGFGDKPWIIGTYIDATLASPEIAKLEAALGLGLGIVLIAVVAGLWVARLIGHPVRELAKTAESVRDLDFSTAGPTLGSRIRELDDAADAFNQMLVGLRWFETYVPQSLVRRLLTLGDRDQVPSEARIVTVLFTDIQSFTALSERLGATETAALLNHHFTIVNTAVEHEHGTIDKYIGDSVMAYWGAPVPQPDHAARACRAVLAIAEAVTADNNKRIARGDPPLNMRIGLHTGPVIAGNIGSPHRINYTVVGDTVNTANRLEQLGKELFPTDGVCALVSAATVQAAGEEFHFSTLGAHHLRGREGLVEVYRLV
ncbi:MAG: adenylate/guanylate cyclase domain-containing protein [Alphaproteobacteria bacterium]